MDDSDEPTVREALETLYRESGNALTPRDVVEAARPEDSPLHRYFTWDDRVAAERHRLDQARVLIRRVRVKYVDPRDPRAEIRHVPQYISVEVDPTTAERAYRSIDDVMEDPWEKKLALQDATRQWNNLLRKFKDLEGFLDTVRTSLERAG